MASLELPRRSWIIIDTNFLIDYFSKPELYISLVEGLREGDNVIVSIELVRCEFIRSRVKDVIKLKSEFFTTLVENLLPIDQGVYKLVQPTIEKYGEDIEKVSLTDIYLACVLQRYSQVLLLTRNHQDFPTKLFSRDYLINIESKKDVKTYGLYQFKKAPRGEIIAQIEEIPF